MVFLISETQINSYICERWYNIS